MEARAALQEVLTDIGVPVTGSITHPPSPSRQPDARRTPSAPSQHVRMSLPVNLHRADSISPWGRAATAHQFTRGISEGGAEVMLNDAAIAEALHEWHRHPRKLRSRSTSPTNKKISQVWTKQRGSL